MDGTQGSEIGEQQPEGGRDFERETLKTSYSDKKLAAALLSNCPGTSLYYLYKNENADIRLTGGFYSSISLILRLRSEHKKALPEESGKAISL